MDDSVRARRVAETIRNLAAEGLQVDPTDMLMLEAYIRGTVTSIDMLTHARQFTTADEYHDWLLEQGDSRSGAVSESRHRYEINLSNSFSHLLSQEGDPNVLFEHRSKY